MLLTGSPSAGDAYTIEEWTPGDHISLVKNPNYFRAAEGLPAFDRLTFRFVSGDEALQPCWRASATWWTNLP